MSTINYFFGKGEYKDVLSCLSTTKVNSFMTSSLPLAQFWEPTKNLNSFISELKKKGLDLSESKAYFEYPTECEKNGKSLKYSKPSMTDLMIINDKFQIAIEAKYTEYSESHYDTVAEWNKDNEDHKNKIKERWFDYLKEAGATKKDKLDDTVPYQFLHRTASACYKCNDKTPVLVYQLFYDKTNKEKKNKFIDQLKNWSKKLGFTSKIKFYIFEVEIKNIDKVKDKYDGVRSDLFLIMKESKSSIFNFDWRQINIQEINQNK